MFPESLWTTDLIMRPIALGDAAAIFDEYAQDPEVTRFLTWAPHEVLADTEAYIARCLASPNARTFTLLGRRDRQLRGAITIRRPVPGRVGFGYALSRRSWGQGLMTEALTEVASWAMKQKGIWRIGDVCDVENTASARVMEKAGFEREGLLKRWIVHPNLSDVPRDCWSFARTR
ncbi:GNAT family N-acetyltransferase [Aureimonas pseudogalii]|uniref:RimJ/RimL family protein N-acetyltransferase n=1 Tax=Aureimonas pseudogalii TaxID=1744844 RepID=A0A7W6H3E6_9HYPH|nr:GNAT family N-acetyltransferase [Aureimonas pseudogalii]MBB3996798.1 RimJ/RimL family protein N-acetyltransferase [Aureimonas pseudogalii]